MITIIIRSRPWNSLINKNAQSTGHLSEPQGLNEDSKQENINSIEHRHCELETFVMNYVNPLSQVC